MKNIVIRPRLAIYCSIEGMGVARAIQTELQHDLDSTIWSQGIFTPYGPGVQDLLRSSIEHDFAVTIFTPDDELHMRGNIYRAPRDNCVWENGMFHGAHGRYRVFSVIPTIAPDLHLPTDLTGIDPIRYNVGLFPTNPQAAVGPACNRILQAISSNNAGFLARIPRLSVWGDRATASVISAAAARGHPIHFILKLRISVKNENAEPVAVTSRFFAFDKLRPHRDVRGNSQLNEYELAVRDTPDANIGFGLSQRILAPQESKEIWIGLDDALDDRAVEDAIQNSTCGRWHIVWQGIGAAPFIERYVVRL